MANESVGAQAGSGISLGTEVKRLGYSLFIRVPDNRLECRCSYVPNQQGSMMTRAELEGFLAQYKIREGVNREAVDEFIVKAAAGIQQSDVLIASGTPPTNGADEYISISVQPSVAINESDETDTQIDMYIVQTFINVLEGDTIGQIIPAEPGTSGRNIMGTAIPAQPGKPLKLKIGKNIKLADDGSTLIAEATGRFCQSSGEISVEEEYVVAGDVNFKVGSINFKGVVDVRGDVLDNFDVTATKGLRVSGNIGVSKIISDGDITFCGMDGQDKGTVVCGGTLRAHFIHDTVVECAGDVIVEVEIHNCTIKSLGRIIVDKGAISGGTYIALGGIESKKIGSASSQHTRLRAGVDYHDAEEMEKLLADMTETLAKARKTDVLSEITELRQKAAELSDRILVLRSKSDEIANAKINVKTTLYENVQMSVGSVSEIIQEQRDGAKSIIENTIEGGLRFLSMTSLDVKATDIELAFIREQKKAESRTA